jgi:YVTN family beta-propeller protein
MAFLIRRAVQVPSPVRLARFTGLTSLWLGASLLAGCDQDTGAGPGSVDPAQELAPAGAREPGHPQGIVDRVDVTLPWGVAVRDDGVTYFTQLAAGGVGRTSTRTRRLDGFVATGLAPTGIVMAPDGATIYIANQLANTVSVLDVASNSVAADIAVGSPLSLAVAPDGRQLFVGTGTGGAVVVVDLATRTIVRTVAVGEGVNGFAVGSDGRYLYASSFLSSLVAEIELETGSVTRSFALGGTPQELVLNRKGTRLYVANEAGYLDEIDLASGQVTDHLILPGGAFGIGVTPDDGQAYVTLPAQGLIQVFKLQPGKLARTIRVGGVPRRIAFSQRGWIAAVTNAAGFITFVR